MVRVGAAWAVGTYFRLDRLFSGSRYLPKCNGFDALCYPGQHNDLL